jgi:hypothetical protein
MPVGYEGTAFASAEGVKLLFGEFQHFHLFIRFSFIRSKLTLKLSFSVTMSIFFLFALNYIYLSDALFFPNPNFSDLPLSLSYFLSFKYNNFQILDIF